MYYTIYKTTNLVNGKIYIGKHQTNDLNDGYLGSGKHLQRAVKKYGRRSFQKEILYIFDNEEQMNLTERALVTEEFVKREDTYNICEGGKGGFSYINMYGLKHEVTEEDRKHRSYKTKQNHNLGIYDHVRVAIALRNRTIRKATNFAVNENQRRKAHNASMTQSARDKRKATMRELGHQRGESNSSYGKIWITNGHNNKKIHPEQLATFEKEGYHKGRVIKNNTVYHD